MTRLVGRHAVLCLFLAALLSACGHRDERVVHAVVPVAQDLREGALVRYRGIQVGQVIAVRIVDTGVQLDLDIKRADAPLRTADQVRVAPSGIFGDRAVEILPGPVSAPKLVSNGWLAAAPPDTLTEIREAFGRAMTKEMLDRLGVRINDTGARKHTDSVHPPARAHP